MKQFFRNVANYFSGWKTSKTSLYFAIWACILYTIANCLFGVLNAKYGTVFAFDNTQTSEWFEFWKWVVISGGGITVAKIIKEPMYEDEDEDELK